MFDMNKDAFLQARVTTDLRQAFEYEAEQRGRKTAALVTLALEEWAEKNSAVYRAMVQKRRAKGVK